MPTAKGVTRSVPKVRGVPKVKYKACGDKLVILTIGGYYAFGSDEKRA